MMHVYLYPSRRVVFGCLIFAVIIIYLSFGPQVSAQKDILPTPRPLATSETAVSNTIPASSKTALPANR